MEIRVLTDQPINIGSLDYVLVYDQGSRPITATQALEYQIPYMVIAIKLLGQQYVPGMALSTDNMDKADDTS